MSRDNEVICVCGAYDHPHRLGGGKCTGDAWCESFRSIDTFDCLTCPLGSEEQCEVITGQEPIKNAPCFQEELRSKYLTETFGYLPLDLEMYYHKQQEDYYYRG